MAIGFKPFADIYRYIGVKALEDNSKPVVLLKSRQTGGTTMASALEMYFMGSGFFRYSKPPSYKNYSRLSYFRYGCCLY